MRTLIQGALHEALRAEFQWPGEPGNLKIQDVPPLREGDVALCIAPLASQLAPGSAPASIGARLVNRVRSMPKTRAVFESAYADGPFVNLTIRRSVLFRAAWQAAKISLSRPDARGKRIGVEYLSPNTNKPLHFGHLRNAAESIALINLLKEVGYEVITFVLYNDRGAHIMKSMLGYLLHGNGQTPESSGKKPDHFVGDFYALYGQDDAKERLDRGLAEDEKTSLAKKVDEMLQKWEDGDSEIWKLWKTMNTWVYQGFQVTERRYGMTFDHALYESLLYMGGKQIALKGIEKGVFQKTEQGAIVYRFPPSFGLDKERNPLLSEILRADGTSHYLTQDLEVAVRKSEDYALWRSIYVVGDEQNDHFRRLFEILKALKYPWADRLEHYSYAMVELPTGKMKSREGTAVDADDLADEVAALAYASWQTLQEQREKKGLKKREVDETELRRRAEIIGKAAIKFFLLKHKRTTRIIFNPEKGLSVEGDTGPFCLYAYARVQSLLKAAQRSNLRVPHNVEEHVFTELGTDGERALARLLIDFPERIAEAADRKDPALLAAAVLALSKAFNAFYRDHKVIEGSGRSLLRERLALCLATQRTLERGLRILGIETLDEM